MRCLDSEEKLKGRIVDLEADYDDIKEKHDGLEGELEDLKSCIIQEHINGLQKGVRQASFFMRMLMLMMLGLMLIKMLSTMYL